MQQFHKFINFNISGFHIVVLFNLSEEKVHIPSNTTKLLVVLDGMCTFSLLRQIYYLTFMCGSTCFGRLSAHHREPTTALGASGFTVGRKRLGRCWSWSGRLITGQTTTNNAPTATLQR
jgi:hypothetical protein